MKAYKGFKKQKNGKLKCRDFIYEEGKTYEMPEDEIELCEKGFHACHEMHQCWQYYPHIDKNIVYHEVECEGKIIESNEGDGKICCSKITIGKEVYTPKLQFFIDCSCFSEGYAAIQRKEDKLWSFIDKDGRLIGDGNQWYVTVCDFSEGRATVKNKNGLWSFIDKEAKLIGNGEQWYRMCHRIYNGYARVQREDLLWSFIAKDVNLIGDSNRWYENVCSFSEGYAAVQRKDGLWSFIDKKGKLIGNGNQWYKHFYGFVKGVARVWCKNNNWIYINKKGEEFSTCKEAQESNS